MDIAATATAYIDLLDNGDYPAAVALLSSIQPDHIFDFGLELQTIVERQQHTD